MPIYDSQMVLKLILTRTMQPTCYPYDCSIVNEDGQLRGSSSRHRVARTRLNSALAINEDLLPNRGLLARRQPCVGYESRLYAR